MNAAKTIRPSIELALVATAVVWLFISPLKAQVALDDEFGHEPSWKSPAVAEVKAQVTAWLDLVKPDAALRAQADALWSSDPSANQILAQVVATIALVDGQAKQLVELCDK